jgi:hypothetical protein
LSGELREQFERALDIVVADLATRPDLVGLVFFGSAARGEAGPGSDLDLYAVTADDASGSVGRTVAGVPTETSFASLAQWTAQVRAERPTIVHAFATGQALFDRTQGTLATLCREAHVLWERGPSPLSSTALLRFRFHLTDFLRDLEGMPEHSATTALMASTGVRLALEAQCALDRAWMPPLRRALALLQPRRPDLVALIERCAQAGFPRSLAQGVAMTVLQSLGGELEAYDTSTVASQ